MIPEARGKDKSSLASAECFISFIQSAPLEKRHKTRAIVATAKTPVNIADGSRILLSVDDGSRSMIIDLPTKGCRE
jgi:hypothetical protein